MNRFFKRYITRQHFLAFTLIELIVVITILAILATIAFLTFGGYSANARDSARLSDLTNLAKSMELTVSKGGTLPRPGAPITLTAGVTTIGYQGYADKQILGILNMSDTKDALDGTYYTYSTNSTQNKYQVLGFLENSDSLANQNSFFSQAYADPTTYSGRTVVTRGQSLGILLQSGTLLPAQIAGQPIDIVSTGTGYSAIFGSKTNEQITGTGVTLKKIEAISSLASTGRWTASMDDINNGSLVGYWDMETMTPDGKLKDLSGNGNNGTPVGGVKFGAGGFKLGKAAYFNRNWINFGTGANQPGGILNFDGKKAVTIESFIIPQTPSDYATQYTGLPTIFSDTDTFGLAQRISYLGDSIQSDFRVQGYNVLSFPINNPINILNNNEYYVVTVFDGVNVKSYLNGVLVSKAISDGNGVLSNNPTTCIFIGADPNGCDSIWYYYFGYIDDVKVYNRALSDDEILHHAKAAGY